MPNYDWALNSSVMVTCTVTSDMASAYLVVGARASQALVLVEKRGGDLVINGVKPDLGDSYPQWLGLLDQVNDLAEGESRFLPVADHL